MPSAVILTLLPAFLAFAGEVAGGDVAVPSSGAVQMREPDVSAFGKFPDGREVHRYTLEVPGGWRATLIDYGAILTSFRVPSDEGGTDVVLGFDGLDGYVAKHPYFGAICGRCSNRIAEGAFSLDGRRFTLAKNDQERHHLHGGIAGFDKKLWKATPGLSDKGPFVEFETESAAGDEGYPGRLVATVRYTLTPDGELWVEMTATTDAPTIVNLVHHSYWNLAGHRSGSVEGHEISVVADRYLPVDAGSIPTGEFQPVDGTPFDFRPERPLPARLADVIRDLPAHSSGRPAAGVDHNFILRGWQADGALRTAALLRDPTSGRSLEILTDQPGIQVYTGNYLDGELEGKEGQRYERHAGVCLETQAYPDSVNHQGEAGWPSVRLDPGSTYRHTMVHRFRQR